MDANEFLLIMFGVGIAGFVILTVAYFAAFRVFGYRDIRPGAGRLTVIHFMSWWLMAAAMMAGIPLGIADTPDPWGAMLMAFLYYLSLSFLTHRMVSRPDRRAALLLPLFPGILFALVIVASSIH